MNWIEIKSTLDLTEIIEISFREKLGVAIFKHSTRCSISSVVKSRLSSSWSFNEELPIYHLDLLALRAVSDLIAQKFKVIHESPQLLLIKDGKCIYNASHLAIFIKDLKEVLEIKG